MRIKVRILRSKSWLPFFFFIHVRISFQICITLIHNSKINLIMTVSGPSGPLGPSGPTLPMATVDIKHPEINIQRHQNNTQMNNINLSAPSTEKAKARTRRKYPKLKSAPRAISGEFAVMFRPTWFHISLSTIVGFDQVLHTLMCALNFFIKSEFLLDSWAIACTLSSDGRLFLISSHVMYPRRG